MIVVLLLVLLPCYGALAADLTLVDVATVYQDQVYTTAGVVRTDTFATVVGYDTVGEHSWPVCDTLYAIVEVYEFQEGQFDWRDVRFMDQMARARSSCGSGRPGYSRVFVGAKVNQQSPLVDIAEAGRLGVWDADPYWPIFATGISAHCDWVITNRPYYRNAPNLGNFRFLPRYLAHFRYLAVHCYMNS